MAGMTEVSELKVGDIVVIDGRRVRVLGLPKSFSPSLYRGKVLGGLPPGMKQFIDFTVDQCTT